MGKDGDFKYKEEQQRLVESGPELTYDAETPVEPVAENGSDTPASSADRPSEKRSGPAGGAFKSHQKLVASPEFRRQPRKRPETGVMVLTLACVFAGALSLGTSALQVGRAGLRAQIGAMFGRASNEGIDSSIDLVQALYLQCVLDLRSHKKPRLDALDAALERTVQTMETAGIKDGRLALLKLRQSASALWRKDKEAATARADEAMQLILSLKDLSQAHGVSLALKNAMADTGVRLANAGEYTAAMPILRARVDNKTQALENLQMVREALGECYRSKGDYQNAFVFYNLAFEEGAGPCRGHDPNGMRRRALMGVSKAKMHAYKEAVDYYFEDAFNYFKSSPDRLRFVADYADAQMGLGNYSAAQKLLNDSMQDLKGTAPRRGYYMKALMSMARYYQHENQMAEAEKYFDLAMSEVAKGSPSPPPDELTQLRNSFGAK